MFLAYTIKYSKSNPEEKTPHTFFCTEHSSSHLVTQIVRYQALLNDLESSDYIFQLITVSDVGQGLSPTVLDNLGAFKITNDLLYEMKQAKLQKQGGAKFQPRVTENPTQPSEVTLEAIKRVFNLPKVNELHPIKYMPSLHPIPHKMMQDCHLWLSCEEDGKIYYNLVEGKTSLHTYLFGKIEGPAYLVQDDGVFYLSSTNPYTGD